MKYLFSLLIIFILAENTVIAGVERDAFGNITGREGPHCKYSYLGTLGGSLGIGATVLLADVTVAVAPKYCVGVIFASGSVDDPGKDEITFTISPEISGTFAASVGPKLQILDAKAFDTTIGASASASAGAEAAIKLGMHSVFVYAPGELKLEEKGATCANDFCDFSRGNAKDHMTSAGLSIFSSLKIEAGIGGFLGLKDVAGVSADIGASATMGYGVEGRLNADSDDKFVVIFKSSVSGSFKATELSKLVMGRDLKLMPNVNSDSVSYELHLGLKFKADKSFNGMSLYFANGFEFTNGGDNDFVKQLKEEAGSCAECAELDKAVGGKCSYSFDISRELAEKYLKEIVDTANKVKDGAGTLNEDTLKDTIKGMYSKAQEMMKSLSSESVPYHLWKEIRLSKTEVGGSLNVDIAKLGLSTSLITSKSYLAEEGNLAGGQLQPDPGKTHKYTQEIAKFKREIPALVEKLLKFVPQLLTREYICRQDGDGTLILYGLFADGRVTVYYFEPDGDQIQGRTWTGTEAQSVWSAVRSGMSLQEAFQNEAG
ncbi:MAG: hypothetical protein PHW04_18505 [Candidatus Wallbacteria bacterium]|nr:hypothetical protein [Candidatus Wallbacteria bacterium]